MSKLIEINKLNKNSNEHNAMYESTTLLAQGLKILAFVNII